MNRNFFQRLSLVFALSIGFSAVVCSESAEAAKKYTITERIEALSARVNAGQKSGELTLKEADDLRNKIGDVTSEIDKYKAKNGGKLSYDKENVVEKDLNKVSLKLTKKELSKRVDKPN